MSYTVQLSSSTITSNSSLRRHWKRRKFYRKFQFLCGTHSNSGDGAEKHSDIEERGSGSTNVFLVERYSNGTSKRYMLDGKSRIQTLFVKHESFLNKEHSTDSTIVLTWLPKFVKSFILPAGFPGSVSDDYLDYMLWQFPTNITGWICHTLVTSSLLKAVGVGSSGTAAAASAAAIRWVSKDGIGAVGRLIIGGQFGSLFDDDPKQWRMYADFIGSAGSIFDLSTQLYPAYFLPLASLGTLTKAVARGLKDPSFRVIQNHFAISGNVGEVAAKEEVWEVSAQLFGLALGVLILDTPGLVSSYPVVASTWLAMRLCHLWLRYQSLSALQFKSVNLKRARVLARSHVLHSTVQGCTECNKEENILTWQRFFSPRIIFGVSLEEMIDDDKAFSQAQALLSLFEKEKHVLTVNRLPEKDFEVLVSFKRGATSLSALRVVWQAYWLYENRSRAENMFELIRESVLRLEQRFNDFIQQLEIAGWSLDQIAIKIPKEPLIDEADSSIK